jgi:opacity protein-like surface antigen
MRERLSVLAALTLGALAVVGLSGLATAAAAQDPPPPPVVRAQRPRAGPDGGQGQGRGVGAQAADRFEVAELQRLFDAYLIMQAQDALQLDDVQFGQFLPKLKALQDTRRRNEQARHQLVTELARLTAPAGTTDEATLKEKLQALQELEGRAAAEMRRAYDTVDQQLDVRRQARFRVFEQNMERRKFQLMLRARRSEAGRLDPGRLP